MSSTAPSLETLRTILRRHLPAGYHAFIFGSRATGAARPGSDWDIGIMGPDELPLRTLGSISEELEELPTLHSFEVVDLSTVPERFREVALRKTIALV